ncbi:cystatin J-like isoform X3 [Rhopilema esculentum]|uniref:cystatin J-like isoform X3 n=1 Tax=Rhopilema esculentum TaxID=499914 RepID=UPI0031E07FE6|eukprot:gene3326-1668_t
MINFQVTIFFAASVCLCLGSLMPGGEREMTKEQIEKDERLQEAVKFAVTEYSSKVNSELTATEIIRAKVQVVAGLRFTALVEMHPSRCVHDPKLKIAPCPPESNPATKCVFTIVYEPWVPVKISVLMTKCLK